ncbi:hypothetical protein ZWY2020_011214 [Hordeum vulgare]|nr:hypothetical protein ZWY2020_011214 [Hordeum vulgare]
MAVQMGCCSGRRRSSSSSRLPRRARRWPGRRASGTKTRSSRSRRAADLLGRMTVAEKIGQMTQIERSNASSAVIEKSVLSGGERAVGEGVGGDVAGDDHQDAEGGAQHPPRHPHHLRRRRRAWQQQRLQRHHLPHNVGLGATRDPNLVKQIGRATALGRPGPPASPTPSRHASRFAVIRGGRCYESFSEDTAGAADDGGGDPGLQGDVSTTHPRGIPFVGGPKHVAGCAKHFVGDGGTRHGISANNTVLSFHDPCGSTCRPTTTPSSRASPIMISLLQLERRQDAREQGFVITDWQAVDKLTTAPHKHYYHPSRRRSTLASTWSWSHSTTQSSSPTSRPRSCAAPSRWTGSTTPSPASSGSSSPWASSRTLPDKTLTGQPAPRRTGSLLEAVRKSLVLLKNGKGRKDGKPVLPSKKAKKILVVGTHAHDLGLQCGGWTGPWQGQSGNGITGQGTTILEAIKSAVDKKTVIDYTEHPDKAPSPRTRTSTTTLWWWSASTRTPRRLATTSTHHPARGRRSSGRCELVKCVVVLVSGRPLVVEPYLDTMDAPVAAWLPGTEGHGVADVLFGDHGFSGKLLRTWVRVRRPAAHELRRQALRPALPFGFGLTTKPTDRS